MNKALHDKLQFATLSLVSLFIMLAIATPSSAASDCGICHGVAATDMRPLDTLAVSAIYRNITTGAFKGSHQTHMMVVVPSTPSATAGGACTKCHGNTVGYTPNGTAHRNGTLNFSANINNSPTAALYGGITFKNQTSVPSLTTCTTVNCHFNATTPTWGATTFASQKTSAGADASSTCQACHTNAGLTGVHAKHLTYYNTPGPVNGCVKCHPNNDLTGLAAFTHATSLAASIRTSFAAAPNSGSGTISGKRTTTQFLSGGSTAGVTCSSLYCHSSGQSATGQTPPTFATPAWSGTVNCGSCHANMTGSGTGSHLIHTTGNAGYDCRYCHNGYIAGTTANTAIHVDGLVQLTFSGSKARNTVYTKGTSYAAGSAVYGSCATGNCHGNAGVTKVWGAVSGKTECEMCHGARKATFDSIAGVTAATDSKAGWHFSHISSSGTKLYMKPMSCAECHADVTSINQASHLNGEGASKVQFGALAKTGGITSVYTTGTCTVVYCHGGGANTTDAAAPTKVTNPTWNQVGLLSGGGGTDCGKCHGNPPNTSGHGGVSAGLCNACHSHVNNNGTFNNVALHIDGKMDGGKCDACHGYPPVQSLTGFARQFNYTTAKLQNYSGGGGAHSVKGHLAFTVKQSDQWAPCLICHPSNNHAQGGVNFIPGNVQIAVLDKYKFDKNRPIVYSGKQVGLPLTTGNCSNVSCHFQKSPKWGILER